MTTCDLICERSTEKYPLNRKNTLHILYDREAYYYYYYYGMGICTYILLHQKLYIHVIVYVGFYVDPWY